MVTPISIWTILSTEGFRKRNPTSEVGKVGRLQVILRNPLYSLFEDWALMRFRSFSSDDYARVQQAGSRSFSMMETSAGKKICRESLFFLSGFQHRGVAVQLDQVCETFIFNIARPCLSSGRLLICQVPDPKLGKLTS